MLNVEDALEALDAITFMPVRDPSGNVHEIKNTWDKRFINDVWQHCQNGQAISTAQSAVCLKLIQLYRDHLVVFGFKPDMIDVLVATPTYKKPPYQSTALPREVRWAGRNKLVFRCKFNSGVIEDIKKLKGINHFLSHPHPTFSRDHKLWIVDVNSGNWERVMDVIKRHRFQFDDTVAQYFVEVANSFGKQSEATVEGDILKVTVRDDDFLDSWLTGLSHLEG